jgi:hypothetical protein
MTFKERLDREKDNLTKIILFNDRGLFFNLVERSAYVFHTRIKPFKVHVKTLKGVDMPFVYIGVPVDKIDEYLQGMTIEKDEQGNVIAHLNDPIDERAFLAWKEHIINQRNKNNFATEAEISSFPLVAREELVDKQTENDITIRQCLQEVKQLNIASMTPMEAMLYLNSLQKRLKDINL